MSALTPPLRREDDARRTRPRPARAAPRRGAGGALRAVHPYRLERNSLPDCTTRWRRRGANSSCSVALVRQAVLVDGCFRGSTESRPRMGAAPSIPGAPRAPRPGPVGRAAVRVPPRRGDPAPPQEARLRASGEALRTNSRCREEFLLGRSTQDDALHGRSDKATNTDDRPGAVLAPYMYRPGATACSCLQPGIAEGATVDGSLAGPRRATARPGVDGTGSGVFAGTFRFVRTYAGGGRSDTRQ